MYQNDHSSDNHDLVVLEHHFLFKQQFQLSFQILSYRPISHSHRVEWHRTQCHANVATNNTALAKLISNNN